MEIKSTWGGSGRNQGRKVSKLRIGRGFTLAVGQQVLCRETFPDGVTPGKIGVIAIENCKDGDYTIKINFDDGSAFVIGVYKE